MNDDGKLIVVSKENGEKDIVNKEKRKLSLNRIPFSLTCVLHKNYILADPTAEEETIFETLATVVLDTFDQLVSLYKPGGLVLAFTSSVQVRLYLPQKLCKEANHKSKQFRVNLLDGHKFNIGMLTNR